MRSEIWQPRRWLRIFTAFPETFRRHARYFVLGGFVEANPLKITVLAEEAIPMAEVNASVIDQRIQNAEEDIHIAKTEAERAKAVETVDTLKLLRAAL
jgi:F-type H+-transporting ATPase subunit epsilon